MQYTGVFLKQRKQYIYFMINYILNSQILFETSWYGSSKHSNNNIKYPKFRHFKKVSRKGEHWNDRIIQDISYFTIVYIVKKEFDETKLL